MSLSDFPIFKGLTEDETNAFTNACDQVAFDAGRKFIEEGAIDGAVYFMTEGTLRVFMTRDGADQELASLEAPCVLGEMEFLSGNKRGASVAATETAKGYRLDGGLLQASLERGDTATLKVFFNISKVLAARLNKMNRRLGEVIDAPGRHRTEDLKEFRKKLLTDWSF